MTYRLPSKGQTAPDELRLFGPHDSVNRAELDRLDPK